MTRMLELTGIKFQCIKMDGWTKVCIFCEEMQFPFLICRYDCFAILHYQFRIKLSLHSSSELKSGLKKPPYLGKTELNHSEKYKFQKFSQEIYMGYWLNQVNMA